MGLTKRELCALFFIMFYNNFYRYTFFIKNSACIYFIYSCIYVNLRTFFCFLQKHISLFFFIDRCINKKRISRALAKYTNTYFLFYRCIGIYKKIKDEKKRYIDKKK